MKDYKVTVNCGIDSISYDVRKTHKGALGFANRVAREAFYGEECEIIITEISK